MFLALACERAGLCRRNRVCQDRRWVLIILGGVRASVWSDRTGRFEQLVLLTMHVLLSPLPGRALLGVWRQTKVFSAKNKNKFSIVVGRLGSIRPYLVAARKWYSEADAGPGAEAGAGFRGRCCD